MYKGQMHNSVRFDENEIMHTVHKKKREILVLQQKSENTHNIIYLNKIENLLSKIPDAKSNLTSIHYLVIALIFISYVECMRINCGSIMRRVRGRLMKIRLLNYCKNQFVAQKKPSSMQDFSILLDSLYDTCVDFSDICEKVMIGGKDYSAVAIVIFFCFCRYCQRYGTY